MAKSGPKKARVEEVLTLPMAPLLDVVMQILCFFVVTYEMDKPEAHLVVQLPSPTPGTPQQQNVDLLEVHVLSNQYLLKGRSMPLAGIGDALAGFARRDKDTSVIIKVSQKAKASQVVDVLDMCQRVGLKNLNVMTLKSEVSS